MSSRVLWAGALGVFWVALWGRPSLPTVASAVVLVAGLVWWFGRTGTDGRYRVHPVALARLAGVVLWDLTRGSFGVAAAVLLPDPARRRTVRVSVDLECDRAFIVALVADLVSLVPGSLTLEAGTSPPWLELHVMGTDDPTGVDAEVHRLESLVLAAFEPLDPPPERGHAAGSGSGVVS